MNQRLSGVKSFKGLGRGGYKKGVTRESLVVMERFCILIDCRGGLRSYTSGKTA